MNFHFIGIDTTKIDIKLQRNNGVTIVDLPVTPSYTDSTGMIEDYTLINGYGNSYRLALIRKDSSAYYSETLYLDGVPLNEAPANRTSANSKIIDLNATGVSTPDGVYLSIYPNPAEDVLYATVYSANNSSLTIKVYSILGNELYSAEANSGQTVSINTSQFASGSYFISVSEKVWSSDPKNAMQAFIICK